MKNSHFWILVIAMTAVMCLVDMAMIPILFDTGVTAEVRQNGVLLHTLPLDEDAQLTIDAPGGGTNTIFVTNGRICVSHATCPDQVCVDQGWVDKPGTPIVCLPHGLVIELKGGEPNVDAAAG